jgi:cytochrome P450 family 4
MLLWISDQQWRVHRKILTPGFHFNILHEFLHIFGRNSSILIDKFEDLAKSGEEFNVFDPVSLCALDIICGDNYFKFTTLICLRSTFLESSMGAKINAQLKEDSEYVTAIRM